MKEKYEDFKHLNPNGRWCMTLKVMASSLILVIILTAVRMFLVKVDMGGEYRNLITATYVFAAAVFTARIILTPTFGYARYRYRIDSESIEIVEGWFWTEHQIIPLNRLHQVSIEEGPIDRIFRLADVKVITAGGSANLKFLPKEEAEMIAESLKARINELAVMNAAGSKKEPKDQEKEESSGEAYGA